MERIVITKQAQYGTRARDAISACHTLKVVEALDDTAYGSASPDVSAPSDGSASPTGSGRDAPLTETVLAVVVAHQPGDWFEETLESLAAQDYEHLSVAVVDAAGSDIADRVHSVIPDAAVIDAPESTGFADAVNSVLVSGFESSFLLICHDDVALAMNVVTALVTQAVSTGADVAGLKLVHWDHPEVIQHIGFDVDRFGVGSDVTGIDELDQEQHDAVREVFAVSSAVMLVRSDLFIRLGGFDAAMAFRGEHIDLCWRARMAGAKVVTVGGAKARHRERLAVRTKNIDVRFEDRRSSLRSMLVNHGRISLLVFLPLAALLTAGEIVLSVVTGHLGRARAAASAWLWNIIRIVDITSRRKANARIRQVRQADVTAMQYLGSVRLTSFMRQRFGGDDHEGPGGFFNSAGRGFLDSFSTNRTRMAWLAWVAAVAAVLFGSRALISGGVPAVGDFASFPAAAGDLLNAWWGGWSARETGAPSSNLGGLLWLGALGLALEAAGGSMGAVRTIWVIAPILIGLAGAYRMLSEVGSHRAQVGALAAYLLLPLASASVAGGSMAGLVGYAATPWLLTSGLRALGVAPFGCGASGWRAPKPMSADRGRFRSWLRLGSIRLPMPTNRGRFPRSNLIRAVFVTGLTAGLSALFVPAAAGLPMMVAAGLVCGSLLVGRPGGILRLVVATGLAMLVAACVALPLVVDLIVADPSWDVIADGRDGSAGSVSLADLLRFAVGPSDRAMRSWLLVMPILLPMLLGRSWRFEQSVRFWMVAMASWTLAFVSQQGVLGFGLPDVQLLLAPAAAAVAALCGMAVVTVQHDLRFSRFGWRQAMVPATVVAVALHAVGSVGLLEDGRWGLARADHHMSIQLEREVLSGSYRVLWIGAPEFMPMQGRGLRDSGPGLAWAATSGDDVTIADFSVTADPGRADLLEAVIDDVVSGRVVRAGRRLAGFGVRYVVLVHRLAPAPFSMPDEARPVPPYVADAWHEQLDLQLAEGVNSALTLFVNTSWVPMRALYPEGFGGDVTNIADLDARPLAEGAAVLSGSGPPWSGSVPGSAEIFVAHTPRPGWELSVDGSAAPTRDVLSWAQAYQTSAGGESVLDYSPPWWRRASQVVGAFVPMMLAAVWLQRRISRQV